MKTLTTLLVIGMFATAVTMADDVDDVKAALNGRSAARNAGDANALVQYHVAGNTSFGGTGGLLQRFDSLEEQRKNRQAAINAGHKFNIEHRHLETSVYGDAAVTTHYQVGTITGGPYQPNRPTRQVNNRITRVWVKQGGQWKMAHQHISPLRISRIEDRFVGTWRLAAFERRGPDGERSSANPYSNGLLVYTSTGHISLQLTRENRQEFEGRASGEEAQAALYSYIAYFGTFTANETQGTITHHRQGHLIPNRVTDGLRYYRFSGNRLMLTAPPTGEGMTTTLTWERIE